ncbi:DUF4105 domain-containing protein [Dyadobacter sp. CY356]|uniref:lipoprotein N-acyltransferase Lnb domain-containing protein n=1 Tax=Dyadobacter sp. CY356 TaxID=2906442 RepID=UPI001F476D1C|nr:DUF4105 domain-containing protein [Dyadobacter sp. CY356]MCF0058786.1 DUF4105 domain-containing protein [Dyadobacter sp. CY356]
MSFNKSTLLIIYFLISFIPVFAQLTENSKISLLTVGPGKDIYSSFGHSALRISDQTIGLDYVYNYGTFTFDENFYINFAKGENIYWLSISPFQNEYYNWALRENRNITQQTLNLTLKQKKALFLFMENNALPQNKNYRYDYFYDNCSTRIDNALKTVFGDCLKFNAKSVSEAHGQSGATIRQLTHQYLQQSKWGELGIETCLGIEMDRKITPEQFKFLPDFLMWNYDRATIKCNGKFVQLVTEKVPLFRSEHNLNKKSFSDFYSPGITFSIICFIAFILTWPKLNKSIFARIFDFSLFFISGTVGVLLLFLWFFTTHYSQVNLNMIWANPLSLFFAFGFFTCKYNRNIRWYYFCYGLMLAVTILAWSILPQRLNFAYLPICLALSLRSFFAYSVRLHRATQR